jgi:hypothetical protein
MNTIKFLTILFFSSILLVSCEDEKGQLELDSEALLNFTRATSNVLVTDGSNLDGTIDFGTLKTVTSDHNVTFTVNTAKSTAIQGVDFDFISTNSVVLVNGSSIGKLKIRYYEASATLTGKILVLNLSSPTIKNAIFNTEHTIDIKITCPIASNKFVGNYLIEETTPFVDGPTLNHNQVVTLVRNNETERQFVTRTYPTYCTTTTMIFKFNLVCDKVIPFPNQQGTCACTSAGLFFSTPTTPASFNVNNDSVFFLTFTNDSTSNCGPPVQTTYKFTKQ